ncbi:MAG: hypothetical protein JOY58_13030, partial [Solirubrobacterales bacterium]|nr:hypothetical protein [Solirubrobacterales bacterium]
KNVISIPATHRALIYQAHLREDLTKAVNQLGGSKSVLACGSVMTEGFQVPMVAWTLGVHTLQIEAPPLSAPYPPAPNVIFQARDTSKASLLPALHDWPATHYQLVARVRTFRVYANCAGKVSL